MKRTGNLIFGNESLPLDHLVDWAKFQPDLITLSRARTAENALKITASWLAEKTFCFSDSVENTATTDETRRFFQTIQQSGKSLPSAIFQTSGTSGKPKIVPLSRANILAAGKTSASNFQPEPSTSWLLCMPLHHVGGSNVLLRSVQFGTDVRFLPHFDASEVAKILSEESSVRFASLVPTQLYRLLENPDFRTHNQFGAILLGGGPANPSLLVEAQRRKIPVLFSYGMSETCGQIAATRFKNRSSAHPETVGFPLAGMEISITDETKNEVAQGNEGLIWVKGAQVFEGYSDENLNAGKFDAALGFCTGDWGKQLPGGELVILSRREDLVVSGGENIVPSEIENVILSTNLAKSVVVIGVPDKEWGQRLVAVLEGNPDDESLLQAKLEDDLPGFKRPKNLFWNLSIPLTETGKIDRKNLRLLLTSRFP